MTATVSKGVLPDGKRLKDLTEDEINIVFGFSNAEATSEAIGTSNTPGDSPLGELLVPSHPTLAFNGDVVELYREILHVFDGREGPDYKTWMVLTDDDLGAHLRGERSFAIVISTKTVPNQCRFVAIDIDKQFDERRGYYEAALRELKIIDAVFCTTGSDAGRGKIIVTLRNTIPKADAFDLVRLIHGAAVRLSDGKLPEFPVQGDVELFPRNDSIIDDGGDVRILGRNAKRTGTHDALESVLAPNGTPKGLDYLAELKPLRLERVKRVLAPMRKNARFATLPRHIEKLIREPWKYEQTGDLKKINDDIFHLASFFATKHNGDAEGEWSYRVALTKVLANSPALPSRDNPTESGDQRNPVKREIEKMSAWRKAKAWRWRPVSVAPKTAGSKAHKASVEYVMRNGLFPHCFGVTQANLAQEMCISKSSAVRQLENAQKSGLVIKLHPGTRYTEGQKPIAAMYGLPGEQDSIQNDVWAKAIETKPLQHAYAKYPVMGFDDPRDRYIATWLAYFGLVSERSNNSALIAA